MILDRIHHWALARGDEAALVYNGAVFGYRRFANAIASARRHLAALGPPVGRTAVVLTEDLANAWILGLALRSLGVDVLTLTAIDTARALDLSDVAWVVTTEEETPRSDDGGSWLRAARIVALGPQVLDPAASPSLDRPMRGARLGGHVLYTSGATGAYKKVFIDQATEERRYTHRAKWQSFDSTTVHFNADFPPWTLVGSVYPLAVWHVGGTVVIAEGTRWVIDFNARPLSSAFMLGNQLRDLVTLAREGRMAQ